MDNLCTVDDCGRAHYARGWCSVHYQRWFKHGTIADPEVYPTVCSIEGCSSKVLAKGWCRRHYLRNYRLGDTGIPPRFQKKPCEACGRMVTEKRRRGLCATCYRQWWRQANPGRDGENYRKWAEAHPEQARQIVWAKNRRRRALLRDVITEPVDREKIIAKYGMICHLCGKPISTKNLGRHDSDLTFDHVHPIKHHGPDVEENLRPAHRSCNSRKGAKPPPE